MLATQALALLFVQFGYSSDSEQLMAETRDTLATQIKNEKAEPEVRAAVSSFLVSNVVYALNALSPVLQDARAGPVYSQRCAYEHHRHHESTGYRVRGHLCQR